MYPALDMRNPDDGYCVSIDERVQLQLHVAESGKITNLTLQDCLAIYPDATEWVAAPSGRYPEPKGEIGAPFADANLKLLVMEALHAQGLIELGTPAELAMHVLKRHVNLEKEGYALIPELYDYLSRYPLNASLLDQVESLSFDGGNALCRYIWYFFDGETDIFKPLRLDGLEHCKPKAVQCDYNTRNY